MHHFDPRRRRNCTLRFPNGGSHFRINTPPGTPTVSLSPDPALTTDNLQAAVSIDSDPDGDPLTYSYEWFENGVLSSYITSSVPSAATNKGELWTVRVVASDGYAEGGYAEASLTINNTLTKIFIVTIVTSISDFGIIMKSRL